MNGYWLFLLYGMPVMLAAGAWVIAFLYMRNERKHHLPPGE